MSDTKLLTCPICDKEVSVALGGDRKTYFFFMTRGIGKNGCKCRLFFESEPFDKDTSEEEKEKIKKDLIKQWNTRKPMDRIVEKLESLEYFADKYTTSKQGIVHMAIDIVKGNNENE